MVADHLKAARRKATRRKGLFNKELAKRRKKK